MKPYHVVFNENFVGRDFELERLSRIDENQESAIIVVYGRRRVGKTELIEQAFRKRNLLKFEGLEGVSEKEQMNHVLEQLAEYTQEPLLTKIQVTHWREVFKLIGQYTNSGTWTIFFEEIQWLANYQTYFISELKYVWDNYFRHNNQLLLILCGSSPSFIINHVIKSRSLHNRSLYEFPLKEFSLGETKQFLKKRADREIIDAYLTIGGIPEYLKRIKQNSSVFLSLCDHAFQSGGFFLKEYERIFVSNLAKNKHYRDIIEYLSKHRFGTRNAIMKHLKLKSGGGLSALLTDLEVCGFIEKYVPFNLNPQSLLARYCIRDAYLQFYFKFIKPLEKNIEGGHYNQRPSSALNMDTYHKWLGYSFERFCRRNHHLFARILGFESVRYKSGAFFNRATDSIDSGYQIDLIYDRDDQVYTVCEIKYLQTKVSSNVITSFEKKLTLLPNQKNRTIQKILITIEGADQTLIQRAYFDRIITLQDIINF
ncbi:MAG: AAA family ATPase [Gammaproteobacteria bacterium]|nr:AAA family ATPase [Gammaproteobacteria bacterium]